MQLSDSELKVMEVIWQDDNLDEQGEITAKAVSDRLMEQYGWQKASNYVYLNRLLKKGAISRRYPNYTIKALIQKEDLTNQVVDEIIEKSYSGSVIRFFSAFLHDKKLSDDDLDTMKQIMEDYQSEAKKKK